MVFGHCVTDAISGIVYSNCWRKMDLRHTVVVMFQEKAHSALGPKSDYVDGVRLISVSLRLCLGGHRLGHGTCRFTSTILFREVQDVTSLQYWAVGARSMVFRPMGSIVLSACIQLYSTWSHISSAKPALSGA